MALDLERQKATFDVKDLSFALYGEAHEAKQKFEKLFTSNPIFDKTNDLYMGRDEYIKTVINRSFETYKIVKKNKDLLSKHSPLHGEGGFYVGGFGTPSGLTDHFALFIQTIMNQATKDQQREWLMKSINLNIIGTYAQTELGHGTNIRGLETTATYDEATDEFIINSPDISAAKWWPGALGLLATHAITYARLIIKGKEYGFHAFMVQIRDENHRPLPGVEVGDIGPKMGYNAYDSGYLMLKNIRIPRFNMLARFQQVEKGGEYKKAPPALAKIAYWTVLRSRVGISIGAGQALGRVLTIAVRYNCARKQGFIDSKKKGPEHPIIDYTIQQAKLFPIIATAYALTFSSMNLRKLLESFDAKLKEGTKADASLLPVLHATSAGLKAFSTELAIDGIEEARRCCGGHSFSLSAGIGMFQMTYLPSITFEGDYVPMALQTARFLVGSVKAVMMGKKLTGPAGYLSKKGKNKLPTTVEQCLDIPTLVAAYEDASRRSTFSVAKALGASMKKMKFEDAWNLHHAALFKAARNHTMTFILSTFAESVATLKDPKVRAVQERLVTLFALSRVGEFGRYMGQTAAFAAAADQTISKLLSDIRPDCLALVDSFGYSDFQLCSTIGNYDNSDMYERLVASARQNPLNRPGFHEAFASETISKFLNKEYLAKAKKVQSNL